ncbi:hypothetical protein [Pantoea agglomerans]
MKELSRSSEQNDERYLLLKIVWGLMVFLTPLYFLSKLPLLWLLAAVAGLVALMILLARVDYLKSAKVCNKCLFYSVFVLAFYLGRIVPAYWNIAAALACIACGITFLDVLGHWLGIPSAAKLTVDLPHVTPEGQTIRLLGQPGEIGMGGPSFFCILFPDGVLLTGIGESGCFTHSGRYFVAPLPSAHANELLVLDRQLKRLYYCEKRSSDVLTSLLEGILTTRGKMADKEEAGIELGAMLEKVKMVELVQLVDLWLTPGEWLKPLERKYLKEFAADGKHYLSGELVLPESLASLPDPLSPVTRQLYQLSINDHVIPLLVSADGPWVWNDGYGYILACRAISAYDKGEREFNYYLLDFERGWSHCKLPALWTGSKSEPSVNLLGFVGLDAQALTMEASLDCAFPSGGSFGYPLHHDVYNFEIDTQNHARVLRREKTNIRLVFSLASLEVVRSVDHNPRSNSQVDSALLEGGLRARLRWHKDNHDGQGAYSCNIGDWKLPDYWLLDHRVSDCGRYIALIPYTEVPDGCGLVVVADIRAQVLISSPPLLVVRLLDFQDGLLSLIVIAGRLDSSFEGSPLPSANNEPLLSQKAAKFCRDHKDISLFYQVCQLRLCGNQLLPIPN